MDATRFQRIGALFDAVVDALPETRAGRLAQLCDDPALIADVLALLRADDRAAAFDEAAHEQRESLARADGDDAAAPTVFGNWRVLRELGRGGMGTVFLAERDHEEFRQYGALKIIRRGMDSDSILARFLRERRLLAQLDHPGIARLLDGGVDRDGRPYFVMDYVDGIPLVEHAARHRLGLRERLRLFLEVCAAVAHAHRQLVVHCDIKPVHVLVTADGTARLLDFGVARLLADGAVDELTHTRMRPFTPLYAAPEQLDDRPPTTATDVYALGGLLYELLTGSRARTLDAEAGLAAWRAELASNACTAPSQRAMELGDPPLPPRALRGDLDTIVLHALQHDPQRRYSGVDALAEDIRRHLDGRPILARRDSLWYRGGRFVARNRYAVGAVVLIVAVSLAAALVSLRQAAIAREHAERADAVRLLLAGVFAQAGPEQNGGQPFTAHQLLDLGQRQLGGGASANPAIETELTALLASLYWNIGDLDEALKLAHRAVEAGEDPRVPLEVRARSHFSLATIEKEQRRFDAALERAREALELARDAGGKGADVAAGARQLVAAITLERGDARAAEPLLRALVDEHRAAGPARSTALVDAWRMLGTAYDEQSRFAEAEQAYAEGVAAARRIGTSGQLQLAYAENDLGLLRLHRGDLAGAEAALRDALGACERLYGNDAFNCGVVQSNLLRVLEREGRFAEALERRQALLPRERELLLSTSPSTVAAHTNFLAIDQLELGRFDDAARTAAESIAIWKSIPGNAGSADIANPMVTLASADRLRGRFTDAERGLRAALEIEGKVQAPTSQWLNLHRSLLADVLRLQGRTGEAVRESDAAVSALSVALSADEPNPSLIVLLAQQAEASLDAGDVAAAVTVAERALVLARKGLPAGNYRLGTPLFALARVRLAQEDAPAAEALAREALAARSPPYPPEDPRALEIKVVLYSALRAQLRAAEADALAAAMADDLERAAPAWRNLLRERMAAARPSR